MAAAGRSETPSSPSNSSVNSVDSTISDNMSFTPERSPFFSESEDDDSYRPGQELPDFDLSHLEDLAEADASDDRFSNEDHEDFEEDEEADDDADESNDAVNDSSEEDTDQYDTPTFSDSD